MTRGSHLLSLHGLKVHWLLYIQLSSMLTGCLPSGIEVMHDPLYKASRHTSTISASASASWGRSIQRITIIVTEGRADYCRTKSRSTSAIPCRVLASQVIRTCEFPDSPKNAICKYELDTDPPSITPPFVFDPSIGFRPPFEPKLVTYSAMVEFWGPLFGDTYQFSDEITYAAGRYPPDLARPIWWHKDKSLDSKIDIALFPNDTDYGNYDFFLRDVDTVVKGAFFNAGQSVSELYTKNREFVNLWAAPFGVFTEGCNSELEPIWYYSNAESRVALPPIVAIMDGNAIFHRNTFGTCSNITNARGWATMDVATGMDGKTNSGFDPVWLLIHESGHFVHGQGDEYYYPPAYGNHAVANACANIFPSKNQCESVGSARGADANAKCEQINNGATPIPKTNPWWHRIIPGEPLDDLMDKNQDVDWLTDCRYCVLKTFNNCESGNCFP